MATPGVEDTLINVLAIVRIVFVVLILREIFFHLIPALKGDQSGFIKARERLVRRRMVEVENAGRREDADIRSEIADEQQLLVRLEKVRRDIGMESSGSVHVQTILADLSAVRNSLNLLEKYEKDEERNISEHLKGLQVSEFERKTLESKEKITQVIETLILQAENLLSKERRPEEVVPYIDKSISLVKMLLQQEFQEEQKLRHSQLAA